MKDSSREKEYNGTLLCLLLIRAMSSMLFKSSKETWHGAQNCLHQQQKMLSKGLYDFTQGLYLLYIQVGAYRTAGWFA